MKLPKKLLRLRSTCMGGTPHLLMLTTSITMLHNSGLSWRRCNHKRALPFTCSRTAVQFSLDMQSSDHRTVPHMPRVQENEG